MEPTVLSTGGVIGISQRGRGECHDVQHMLSSPSLDGTRSAPAYTLPMQLRGLCISPPPTHTPLDHDTEQDMMETSQAIIALSTGTSFAMRLDYESDP